MKHWWYARQQGILSLEDLRKEKSFLSQHCMIISVGAPEWKKVRRINIELTEVEKITSWFCKRAKLTGYEKNNYYKLLFNCIPDK